MWLQLVARIIVGECSKYTPGPGIPLNMIVIIIIIIIIIMNNTQRNNKIINN